MTDKTPRVALCFAGDRPHVPHELYAGSGEELVLAEQDLKDGYRITNRYADGVVGVSDEDRKDAELDESPFCAEHGDIISRWIDADDLVLTLPDGTRFEGRGQFDEMGRLKVEMATCGACGFSWNDELITGITPTPSGRCPNEFNHPDPDDEYHAGREDPNYVYVVAPSLPDEDPAVFANEQDANAYAETYSDTPTVYRLLICKGEVAQRMIYEARGDDEDDGSWEFGR